MMVVSVAIYVRVSTEDQNPENQIAELRSYCDRSEYVVYGVYTDKCSGRTEDRPEFQRLMADMRQRRFKAILVWKLDRIGRSLPHLLKLLQEMQNRNVDFICLTQNIDTSNASGRLMFQMMGAFSEFESSLVSERTKLGMQRAKREGIHCGRPPSLKG
jgi:DNA invertase Pin-like site-specific DNA recombinase